MAVYEGARPRAAVASRRVPEGPGGQDAPVLPRRRARTTVRAGRRPGRVGLILVGIVLAFATAFFSLAQTIRVSATGYDIDRLMVDREQLEARRQQLRSDLDRLGREPAIRKQAIDLGLGQLADPLVVPAR